jgi:hypothetical protein
MEKPDDENPDDEKPNGIPDMHELAPLPPSRMLQSPPSPTSTFHLTVAAACRSNQKML